MARLTVCADDFGFSQPVSRTIVALACAGKLNATTCMTAMAGWRSDARLLDDLPRSVAIGLHLTLTLETPATAMPALAPAGRLPTIGVLSRAAHADRLPLGEIAAEIAVQFDRFVDATGRLPDFVDAHQHAHGLRGIRDLVLDLVARRVPDAWVRSCTDRLGAMIARPWRGKAVASALGTRALTHAARLRGIAVNDGFAGHYGFDGRFAEVLPDFFRRPGTHHLIMCHPGAGTVAGDAIAAARHDEAAVLARCDIAALAAAHGLEY